MPDYNKLPEHIRPGMERYIEEGIIPGRFLSLVIQNDLVGAFGYADDINSSRLKDICDFMYNDVPIPAWGSKKKMEAWSESKGSK